MWVDCRLVVGLLLYTDWGVGGVSNNGEEVLEYRDRDDGAVGGGGTFE